MKILVLGGDGYLGWPTALHLSALGHEVTVVDNLVRREYDREMGVDSLVPIASLAGPGHALGAVSRVTAGSRCRVTPSTCASGT